MLEPNVWLTLCLAINNARLNFAVSQTDCTGLHKTKNRLNIGKLIIGQGANDSEIIRIIAALVPCIEESYVVEALKYCAQQKAYWRLLEPLLNRLPNIKIRDLPVLKARAYTQLQTSLLLDWWNVCDPVTPHKKHRKFSKFLCQPLHLAGIFLHLMSIDYRQPYERAIVYPRFFFH